MLHPIIYPALTFSLFILVGGLVILLRPITKRFGSYLEVLVEERRRRLDGRLMAREDTARMTALLEAVDQRLAQLEERQEFTDRLLTERGQSADHRMRR